MEEYEENSEKSQGGIKLKQQYIKKKFYLFNKFYRDLYKETIELIQPEYIKFVTQLSPYFNSLNFEWIEKYKYLASLDNNLIKSYHQKIFVVTFMLITMKLNMDPKYFFEKKRLLFKESLENFFTYEQVYDVFLTQDFNFFKSL